VAALRMFALAGGLIGAINGLALVALSYLALPPLFTIALTIAFGLLLTGALHEDGLADSADGLFGGGFRERRLEIMRDSRIGSYGALALGLALLARAGAFQGLLLLPRWQVIALLAGAGAFSRAMMVDLIWATRPARLEGLSASAGRPSRNVALFAILSGAAIAIWAGWAVDPMSGVEAIAVALLVTALMRRLSTRLLGGQTGDICGATQVLAELGMLGAYLSTLH